MHEIIERLERAENNISASKHYLQSGDNDRLFARLTEAMAICQSVIIDVNQIKITQKNDEIKGN